MTIRSRTAGASGGGVSVAQSRCGAASRATHLGLAGLLWLVDQTWEVVATVIGGVVAYERRPLADGEAQPAPTP